MRLLILAICSVFLLGNKAEASLLDRLPEYSWELSAEISHISYKEPSIEEKGLMYGIDAGYTYRSIFNGLMLRGEGRFSFGQVDYKGQLNDGTPYDVNGIDDYMWEIRGLAGYDFSVIDAFIFTPYIGVGHRYLNDDTSFDPAGYERESDYWYSPVGIEITAPLENRWTIGITLEYDYFWEGQQESHLSDVDPTISDMSNDQKDGYGYRGSIRFQRRGRDIDFVIEPFIRYWNIEQSEITNIKVNGVIWGYGWEPENTSTEYGIKFTVKI